MHGVTLSPSYQSQTLKGRGSTASYTFTVTNAGNVADTILLAWSGGASGWKVSLSASSVSLAPGASASFTLTMTAGKGASSAARVDIVASSAADASASASGAAETFRR
jgi:uncharacterized membrane protein